jgi:competence protein ComGC
MLMVLLIAQCVHVVFDPFLNRQRTKDTSWGRGNVKKSVKAKVKKFEKKRAIATASSSSATLSAF